MQQFWATVGRRHTGRVIGVAFDPGGKSAVTAQANGLVRFFDPVTGRENRVIELTGKEPGNVASIKQFGIDHGGRYLAAVGLVRRPAASPPQSTLWIASLAGNKPLRTIDVGKSRDLQSLAISPDGTTIATGAFDGEVKLWDVASGECKKTAKLASNQSVFSLSYSSDGGTLATIEAGKGVKLWAPERDEFTFVAVEAPAGVAPFFSADGQFFSVNTGRNEAIIWDHRANRKHRTLRGSAVGFAPDSRSLAVFRYEERTLVSVNVETGEDLWTAGLGSALETAGIAYSSDAQTVIVGWGNVLRFFDAHTGHERFAGLEAHQGGVSALGYTPDTHTLVTAGDDGTIRQWDVRSAKELSVISDSGIAHRLAISPDGEKLATAAQKSPSPAVRIWDRKTGRLLRECLPGTDIDKSTALAFSSDGNELLYYSHKHGLKIVDIATGELRPAVEPRFLLGGESAQDLSFASCAFSPANRYLAACTDLTTHVVELSSGAERFSCPGYVMSFTPDGNGLAVATAGDLALQPGGNALNSAAVNLVEIASGARKTILVPTEQVVKAGSRFRRMATSSRLESDGIAR